MELTLKANGFQALSMDEMLLIDGGVNWDRIATGAAILGGGLLAIASLPATLTVGAAVAAYAGASLIGSAAGYYVGTGCID